LEAELMRWRRIIRKSGRRRSCFCTPFTERFVAYHARRPIGVDGEEHLGLDAAINIYELVTVLPDVPHGKAWAIPDQSLPHFKLRPRRKPRLRDHFCKKLGP